VPSAFILAVCASIVRFVPIRDKVTRVTFAGS
jgi:hypothetical protein